MLIGQEMGRLHELSDGRPTGDRGAKYIQQEKGENYSAAQVGPAPPANSLCMRLCSRGGTV
jgi:hypothetical protein